MRGVEGGMNGNLDCHLVSTPSGGGDFLVDGFRLVRQQPRVNDFFLTHFHSDHYQGLSRSTFLRKTDDGSGKELAKGKRIHCTATTAELAIQNLRVQRELFHTHEEHSRFSLVLL